MIKSFFYILYDLVVKFLEVNIFLTFKINKNNLNIKILDKQNKLSYTLEVKLLERRNKKKI